MLRRAIGQQTPDPSDDRGELLMVESPDEDAASMQPTLVCPLAEQWSKVFAVSSDQDSLVARGEGENVSIFQPFELGMVAERGNVVAVCAQRRCNRATGKIRIE